MRCLARFAVALFVATSLEGAVIREFPLPEGTNPSLLTIGPDGNVWYAGYSRDKIGIITPAGVITEYNTSPGCRPFGITLASDGRVWYTCYATARIGAVDHTGFVDEFTMPQRPAGPISPSADGNIWFSGLDGNVHVVNMSGVYQNSRDSIFSAAMFGIARGGDGATWVTGAGDEPVVLGLFDGAGHVSYHRSGPPAAPSLITWCEGTGGAWVADRGLNRLLYVNFRKSPYQTAYQLAARPDNVACGADGSIWYAQPIANKVGRLKPDRTIEEFDVPTPGGRPFGLVVAPNGDVWFAENFSSKLGRIQLEPTGDVNADGQVTVSDIFYLVNYLFAAGPPPLH